MFRTRKGKTNFQIKAQEAIQGSIFLSKEDAFKFWNIHLETTRNIDVEESKVVQRLYRNIPGVEISHATTPNSEFFILNQGLPSGMNLYYLLDKKSVGSLKSLVNLTSLYLDIHGKQIIKLDNLFAPGFTLFLDIKNSWDQIIQQEKRVTIIPFGKRKNKNIKKDFIEPYHKTILFQIIGYSWCKSPMSPFKSDTHISKKNIPVTDEILSHFQKVKGDANGDLALKEALTALSIAYYFIKSYQHFRIYLFPELRNLFPKSSFIGFLNELFEINENDLENFD